MSFKQLTALIASCVVTVISVSFLVSEILTKNLMLSDPLMFILYAILILILFVLTVTLSVNND